MRGAARIAWPWSVGVLIALLAAAPAAEARWRSARLSTTSAYASVPRVAFDQRGNAVAVWQQEAGSEPAGIGARVRARGGHWSRTYVARPHGDATLQLGALAIAGRSRVLVLAREFQLRRRGAQRLLLLELSHGRWSRRELGRARSGTNLFDLALAANANGDAIAAWVEARTNGGAGPVIGAWALRGDSFARARQLSRGGSHSPSVAVNRGGTMLVAWQQQHGLQARLARVRGRFGSVQDLGQTAGAPLGTQAALAADGRGLIAWKRSGSSGCGNGLYGYAYKPAHGGFASRPGEPICERSGSDPFTNFDPRVRVGFGPGPLVALDDAGGDTGAARVLSVSASGAETGSALVSPPGAVLRDFVTSGVRSGAVSILYDKTFEPPGPHAHLYVTLRRAPGAFTQPELIAPPGVESGAEARLAIDPRSGHTMVVWDAGRIVGGLNAGGRIQWAADY